MKKRELREYTRAEIKRHNKENDLWLIIKSKAGDGRLKVRAGSATGGGGGAALDRIPALAGPFVRLM